jgi:hypothetical protein
MSKADLKTYIELDELMRTLTTTHEANRRFGLAHPKLIGDPMRLLGLWVAKQRHLLQAPKASEHFESMLSQVTALLLLLAVVLGFFTGAGLLQYHGDRPINVLYFFGAVFVLPMATMPLPLIAMWRAGRSESMLVHLLPAYWMEQIVRFARRDMQMMPKIAPLVVNRMMIKRSQELGAAFYLGLLVALIGMVASRDIAFGWNSTLQITSEEFHRFTSAVAIPWKACVPQAVPSFELIEKSRYFRLGGGLDEQMIRDAALLGEWWKFLAMTTLVYALLTRLVLFVLASFGYSRAIYGSMLAIDGVRELLHQIQEPLIKTQSPTTEEPFVIIDAEGMNIVDASQLHYQTVIGWALDKDTVALYNEREGITASIVLEAGGLQSLEDDRKATEDVSGNILLYVKSWEPPTMDFIDFLDMLCAHTKESITIYPVGIAQRGYRAAEAEFDVWAKRIGVLAKSQIRMKR